MPEPDLQQSKHIPIENSAEEIARGTNRKAERIIMKVRGGIQNKFLQFVRKTPINENFSAEKLAHELRVHKALQQHNIPHIPTFRRDPENRTHVYCTDLTANDTKYVFSKNNIADVEDSMPTPQNSESVLLQIKDIARECAQAGLKVHRAGWYFVIDKKSLDVRVLIGDYKQVEFQNNDPNWQEKTEERFRENLDSAIRTLNSTANALGLSVEETQSDFKNYTL
jgi:hypothetical protein